MRQKPVIYNEETGYGKYFFIADFYGAASKLVIELDGKCPEFQRKVDYNRDLVLKNLGIKVLRIKNEELKQIEKVMQKILTDLD